MGLLRIVLKSLPFVAAGTLGYYIGTIDSGQYECVFEPTAYEQHEYAQTIENHVEGLYENDTR